MYKPITSNACPPCICVCVCERERGRERVSVCVWGEVGEGRVCVWWNEHMIPYPYVFVSALGSYKMGCYIIYSLSLILLQTNSYQSFKSFLKTYLFSWFSVSIISCSSHSCFWTCAAHLIPKTTKLTISLSCFNPSTGFQSHNEFSTR